MKSIDTGHDTVNDAVALNVRKGRGDDWADYAANKSGAGTMLQTAAAAEEQTTVSNSAAPAANQQSF